MLNVVSTAVAALTPLDRPSPKEKSRQTLGSRLSLAANLTIAKELGRPGGRASVGLPTTSVVPDGSGQDSKESPQGDAEVSKNHDTDSVHPWWLMTPGCWQGKAEDAEDEFLMDEDHTALELEALKSCCVDRTSAFLLKRIPEALRVTVLQTYDDASNYVKYRNNLKDNVQRKHASKRANGVTTFEGPRVNNTVLSQGRSLLCGEPHSPTSPKPGFAEERYNKSMAAFKHGAAERATTFARAGAMVVDTKERSFDPSEPSSPLSPTSPTLSSPSRTTSRFHSDTQKETIDEEDVENKDEDEEDSPFVVTVNTKMRHSRMMNEMMVNPIPVDDLVSASGQTRRSHRRSKRRRETVEV